LIAAPESSLLEYDCEGAKSGNLGSYVVSQYRFEFDV
jgi:hypothetical protein